MCEQVTVLLSNKSLRTLANQPMQHPHAQNADEGDYFVNVEIVTHKNDHEQNLKDFLL
jgi:hypothetical protein